MAKKADFSGIETGRDTEITAEQATTAEAVKLAEKLERTSGKRKQQSTATLKEQAERKDTMRTQGRKGCKAARLNISINPKNKEFLNFLSRATGKPITHLINEIVDEYRQQHPEVMEAAQAVIEALEAPLPPAPAGKVRNRAGAILDYKKAAEMMDDEIRETLESAIRPCSNQKFFSAYEKAHRTKYGEIWELSKENPAW